MFGIPVKLLLYLGAALALGGLYWAWHSHVEALGAAQVETRDARALADKRLQDVARLTQDAQTNEQAKKLLAGEVVRLAALADRHLLPVRLCSTPSHSSPGTAPARVASGTESPGPAGGGVPGVSTGVADQPDIGAPLQQLALRADQLSAQLRAIELWERGISPTR
jgi:hypothetical protein